MVTIGLLFEPPTSKSVFLRCLFQSFRKQFPFFVVRTSFLSSQQLDCSLFAIFIVLLLPLYELVSSSTIHHVDQHFALDFWVLGRFFG